MPGLANMIEENADPRSFQTCNLLIYLCEIAFGVAVEIGNPLNRVRCAVRGIGYCHESRAYGRMESKVAHICYIENVQSNHFPPHLTLGQQLRSLIRELHPKPRRGKLTGPNVNLNGTDSL